MPGNVQCRQCGVRFKAYRKDAKFCSDRCRVKSHVRAVRLSKNPHAAQLTDAVSKGELEAMKARADKQASYIRQEISRMDKILRNNVPMKTIGEAVIADFEERFSNKVMERLESLEYEVKQLRGEE